MKIQTTHAGGVNSSTSLRLPEDVLRVKIMLPNGGHLYIQTEGDQVVITSSGRLQIQPEVANLIKITTSKD